MYVCMYVEELGLSCVDQAGLTEIVLPLPPEC